MKRFKSLSAARAGVLLLVAALAAACTDPTPQGVVRRRIIGGTEADAGAFPETVALMDLSTPDPVTYMCSGTLIAPDLVLSAAHCLFDWRGNRMHDADIGIYFGHDASSMPRSQALPITKSFIPTGYPRGEVTDPSTGMGRDDDISLLVLTAPVTDVTPAPILPFDQVATITQGTMLLLVGYGTTTLDYSGPDGVKFYASSPAQTHSDWEIIIGATGQPDTCPGDSGGPAFLDQGGTRTLVGVTVRAFDNATQDCGEGGIYTLAPAYLSWIAQQVGALDGGTPQHDAGQPDGAGGQDGGSTADGGRDGDGSGGDQPGKGCSVAGTSTVGQRAPSGALLLLLPGLLFVRLASRRRVPARPRHRTPI